ncbi:MAG: helix-turn-helix domain-containing protein [Planctomycetota bacterium]
MPNLNKVLGDEIRRLARKEARAELASTQKSLRDARRQLTSLRRQVHEQRREIKALARQLKPSRAAPEPEETDAPRPRFSADWVAKHRAKLGLSAADYGKLVEVSPLTIYNWEKGASTPREEPLRRWARVRKLGKREALRRLEAMAG